MKKVYRNAFFIILFGSVKMKSYFCIEYIAKNE